MERTFTQEEFKAAYQELEGGDSFVRICDLRRHLGWSTQEFDAMLVDLRNWGKIHLRPGEVGSFTKEDIRESFIDEDSVLRLTVAWKQ